MSSLFKGATLFVALTCSVWVAVLWRWEVTARDTNTRDIVVYLVALPLTAFALVLLLRWAWRGAEQRREIAAAAAAGGSAAASAVAAAEVGNARRPGTVQLIAAPLVCAAGASAAELQAAAKDGAPRPTLDPELRYADGLPVFTARIASLDPSNLAPLLEPLMETASLRPADRAGIAPRAHVRRALAALQEPLLTAVQALAPWATPFAAEKDRTSQHRIRVLIGLPADWTPFEQELGHAFAAAAVGAVDPSIPAACFEVTTLAVSGEELLLHADRLLQTLAPEQRSDPLIVAACDSAIGEDSIDALERGNMLFSSSKRPRGRIPGEAAAALVLAGAEWPASPDTAQPLPHLHRPTLLRRDKSVDAPGRVGSGIALQAMTQAVATSGLPHEAIGSIACDADHHTARGVELSGGALDLLPHLDVGEDISLLGTVTGAVGAVSALLVVACAAERAKADGRSCLALTVGDPFARLALVVLPGRPAPDGDAIDAAAAVGPK